MKNEETENSFAMGIIDINLVEVHNMKYTENAINILTALSYKGIGNAWIVKNLKGNESVDVIVSLLNKKNVTSVEEFKCLKKDFEIKISQKFEDCCDGLVALGDHNFPQYRGNVKESEQPIFLFYKGDLSLLGIENKNITVIGLLNPDENIENREKRIIAEIIKNDITVISGLAFGCDSIAHQQALIGGKTVAILPSPLNNILPAKNKKLAFEIVEKGGLLITEYYEDFKSIMELSSRYEKRDRLQALFCDTIILAASYAQDSATRWKIKDQKLDSGARLAMGYAKNYNIPMAIMYDKKLDIGNPMFDLNRQLIAEKNNIIILTKKSLNEIIAKIKLKKTSSNSSLRTDLFNVGE